MADVKRQRAEGNFRLPGHQRVLIFGFWTLFGLLESTNAFVAARSRGVDTSFLRALIGNMPWWWVWGLLTPLVFALARRFRLDRGVWPAAAAVHMIAALAVTLLHVAVVGTLYYYTHGHVNYTGPLAQVAGILFGYLPLEVLTYWAVAGGYYAFEFYRRFRDGELHAARLQLRAAQAESQAAEARLSALRMELNPHFLFNSLNAIAGLVRRRENDAAVRMLALLGDLLRQTLSGRGDREVSLEHELELVGRYIEIERIRFRDRLGVDIHVEPDALAAAVPPLILQPLVENALRHGIAPIPGPGRISIRAERRNGRLRLEVRDTGAGFDAEAGDGVGLANTRARLEHLYGAGGDLVLENAAGGGALATVTIPFHPATERAHVPA